MDYLPELLQLDHSPLARSVRWSLYGLRFQLQQALNEVTNDPGRSLCQKFLQDLDDLLVEPGSKFWIEDTTMAPLKLDAIAKGMLSDRELMTYLNEINWNSTNDADLWNELQRFLLRVPEPLAKTWRERLLKCVEQIGAKLDRRKGKSLAFSPSESLYPGLSGAIEAQGLRCSHTINPNDHQAILETIVQTCLQWLEEDATLYHALKSLDRFRLVPLNSSSERDRYKSALIERLNRVQKTADALMGLRYRLDLDEAIHSLVYVPCVDRDSWWGKLHQEARRILEASFQAARQAGYQARIHPLWGIYADILKYSKDDLRLDVGGVPGEVSACLRVYARIEDEVIPGRVLYRSK